MALISRLSEQINGKLARHVDSAAPLAILDFPDIRNCGDSAIWLGEIAWLWRQFGKQPSYVCRRADFAPENLRAAVPEGPIFIHGGGNFGDIWIGCQNFREQVIETFPDRTIIQFPQSIHYSSMERADQTARIIEKHSDFILYVRDAASLEFAQRKFQCEVHLCPDMAFCIGPLANRPTSISVLAMLREDREKARNNDWHWSEIPKEDWITERRHQRYRVKLAKLKGMLMAGASSPSHRQFRKLDAAAHQRFERGIRQISRAKSIVTDRLHVHICCTLLGLPHAVLDNSYGKISGHMDAFYPEGTEFIYRATTLQDAVDWARAAAGEQASA